MPARDYYLPKRNLVAQNDGAMIERPDIPRSKFTNAWTHKTTFDAGYLVPILVDEILPGDNMQYRVTAYVRMATPLFPLFDNQRVDTFFFFVPNRLVWENWAKFMGEQANPADSIAYTVPILGNMAIGGGYPTGSIFDHMGLPTIEQITGGETFSVNVLPLRAYNLIYNQWFRDQNIINSAVQTVHNGPDPVADFALRRRAKSHDYFTSALPWPQKFTAPATPLSGTAPIIGLGIISDNATTGPVAVYETQGLTSYPAYFADATSAYVIKSASDDGTDLPAIYADLSAATGVTINAFRQAFLVQALLERDARGGTRYVELILSHFGVRNPDYRLQRPEYIGGGQTQLQITPIAQTAPTTELPVGALGATGTAAGQHTASYAATEHGYIIGLINIKSELSYGQGLHKMWSRSTRFDFYFPALAALGEQAILRKELYMTGAAADDDLVFGYQERWHEYRTRQSEITGMFRSNIAGTLDAWHLGQWFAAPPTLSQAFIEDTPDMERVLAAGEEAELQQYLADILIQRTAVRPLPLYGTPALLGRF